MSDEKDKKWRSYALDNRARISELEKKINDSLLLPTIVQHGRDHTRIDDKIAELKEEMKTVITPYNYSEIKLSLNNNINKLSELTDLIQKIGVKVDFTSNESGQALKEIAELKKLFDNHNCLRSWQKNIKVHNLDELEASGAVSYTHLTLPTILLV